MFNPQHMVDKLHPNKAFSIRGHLMEIRVLMANRGLMVKAGMDKMVLTLSRAGPLHMEGNRQVTGRTHQLMTTQVHLPKQDSEVSRKRAICD
jgi:hypothetical protein